MSDDYFCPPTYRKVVEDFGYEIILEVTDQDYQGDSRFVLRDGYRYGYLYFGWGSCSGCDALQACNSDDDLGKLRAELRGKIVWFDSRKKTREFLETRDWEATEGTYGTAREFSAAAVRLLA